MSDRDVSQETFSLLPFFNEEISEPLSLPTSKVDLNDGNSIEYDVYDARLTFQDWLKLFVAEYRQQINNASPSTIENGQTLFSLMDDEDIKLVEQKLDIRNFSGFINLLFYGGFYNRIRSLDDWEQIKNKQFNRSSPSRTWQEVVDLCEMFERKGIIGNCPDMVALYYNIAQVCEMIIRYPEPEQLPNVLITGEPGTGKEKLARTIHDMSGRKGSFLTINCGAIPIELLESELFGVTPNYPGLHSPEGKKGILQSCDKGTIQLDEINKMPRYHQDKILRVLQEREIMPLGATSPESLDILFIATSNEDLDQKVQEESFARDLHGRLLEATIEVPPLLKRSADIPKLVHHFLEKYKDHPLYQYRFPFAMWVFKNYLTQETRRKSKNLNKENLSGGNNIRQLENLITRLVRRSLPLKHIWSQDPDIAAIKKVMDEAKPSDFPMSKTTLAQKANIRRQSLYDKPNLKAYINQLVSDQKIKG